MNRWFTVLLLLAALLACLFLLRRSHRPDSVAPPGSPAAAVEAAFNQADPAAVAAIESAFAPAPSAVDAAAVQQTVVPVPPPLPASVVFTNLPPATVMENVRRALRDYASRFNGNPVGTNPEITRALAGDNPRQVNFLNEESGVRLNEQGELIDPWGLPLFLHQLSAHEMEIRSAGPDRRLWTEDDLVTR